MDINYAVLEALTFIKVLPGASLDFDIHDPANRQAVHDFCVDEAFRIALQYTKTPAARSDLQYLPFWQVMCCHATYNEFNRCLKRLQAE